MSNKSNHLNHCNLYYIFLEDKQKHTLPPSKAEFIWKRICENMCTSPLPDG